MRKMLPEQIETSYYSNEGYDIKKRDDDIIIELVEGFNELIGYLMEKEDDERNT